jgi:hypothetical protein
VLAEQLSRLTQNFIDHRQVTSGAFAEFVSLVEKVKMDCYQRIEKIEKVPVVQTVGKVEENNDLSEVKL